MYGGDKSCESQTIANDRFLPSVLVPDWVSCCVFKENDNEKDEFVASH